MGEMRVCTRCARFSPLTGELPVREAGRYTSAPQFSARTRCDGSGSLEITSTLARFSPRGCMLLQYPLLVLPCIMYTMKPFLQIFMQCASLTIDKRIVSQRGKRMYVGTKTFCKKTMSAYTAVFSTVTSPRSFVPVNLVKSSGCLYGRAREGVRYMPGELA